MIQRKTQIAEYWHAFSLTPADVDFLRTLMLDREQPMTTQELAVALVTERCRREEVELRAELAQGTIYQPKNRYKVGDKLVFPALDFRVGEVVDLRPGQNPEYGDFQVITVEFGANRRQRSFAAGLAAPHKLNVDMGDLLAADGLATPEKLLTTVAKELPATLRAQLAERPDFVAVEDRWLPRSLLADIHVGHLNIAEAAIEMRGEPVDAATLLKELDLPQEIRPDILNFSLQSALTADGRFDQVGPGASQRWFLKRLEPPEALQVPPLLQYSPIPYERGDLPEELRRIEWELDDEWSEEASAEPSQVREQLPVTTILLTYPHAASGTLPLNRHSRPIFPRGQGERTMVTLVDGRWGQKFPGWVVHGGRYVAGLRAWFGQHKLPAGAYITLERRDRSGEVVVDFRPKRMRREWTRRAHVLDGPKVDFELRKQEVACEYDEEVILADDKPEDILKLRASPPYAQASLADLVYEVFVDLAGLSQSGAVHAKTVYSAVNVLRRCPPGPIFACLASDPRIQSSGGGLYRLAV